ncbi:threonine/serine exporter ThrE family protein [Nocardioides sp.]|uniref:threonine/serine ThrE exporter family protein n=1 Tax=Nocardioides sp. TaxID=35761 RepID=UPI0027204E15|nr:threonine/serine exporter family protein [Nocardioides sp.]MDO9456560.1 threonine/serine exporter family protein [Nocardioides sp.]
MPPAEFVEPLEPEDLDLPATQELELPRRTTLVLDFCLRIGELLLASGAGAADVTATMLSVARAFHADEADVDITFTSLTMSHQTSPDEVPLIATRHVQRRVIDYQDLTRVDHLVRGVIAGELGLREGRAELRRIVSTGHDRPRWAVTGGWAAMAAGVAVQLGGDVWVALLAALAAVLIDRLQLRIARRRLPVFYQQVAGGGAATLVAVAAAVIDEQLDLGLDVSQVITANIVLLLAGIGFMGALQDALTGFYITAGARITEAMLSTAGIIAGVSGGLSLASAVGVDLPTVEPGATGIQGIGLAALGSAVAAAAFAFSSYSPRRALLPIALVAAVAVTIWLSIEEPGIGRSWSVGFAALFVGLVGYAIAARLKVPPLIVVVSAVVPMLPGIAIYRGLSLLGEGSRRDTSLGLVALIGAASVALALAAGVILGEYLAQPLAREARRVESRLAGPRLVGPVRMLSRRSRSGRRGGRTTGPHSPRRTAPAPPTPAPTPTRTRPPRG